MEYQHQSYSVVPLHVKCSKDLCADTPTDGAVMLRFSRFRCYLYIDSYNLIKFYIKLDLDINQNWLGLGIYSSVSIRCCALHDFCDRYFSAYMRCKLSVFNMHDIYYKLCWFNSGFVHSTVASGMISFYDFCNGYIFTSTERNFTKFDKYNIC